MSINSETKLDCDNCGTELYIMFEKHAPEGVYEFSKHDQYAQIDNGMTLNFAGGYGMFTDLAFQHEKLVYLCHDCVATMFRSIPKATEHLNMAGRSHPYETEEPCCEWGWT
jgi:hypothetical protein